MERYLRLKNPWWEGKQFDTGFARPKYLGKIKQNLDQRLMQVITGLRRVGKSTITLQVIDHLIKDKKIPGTNVIFFSVDEPSLSEVPIIDIINFARALNGLDTKDKVYVIIDEIQFRENWEKEIKSLYDSENIKFILTGSSALLLSERITYLTGRYTTTRVFPLDFGEYLIFKKSKLDKMNPKVLEILVEDYLQAGGMPEYVLNKPDRYLETTVESILFKDLVSKFQIRNPKILSEIIYLLSDRAGHISSVLKLSKILEVNKDTLNTYLEYLDRTFIISELRNYSNSRNKQIYNPSKYYFSDLGISNVYSSKRNLGALAENTIYNKLFQSNYESLRLKFGYWYEDQSEVDFVVDQNRDISVVESKYVEILDEVNLNPLLKCIRDLKPSKVTVVTKSIDEEVTLSGYNVRLVPLHQFLLNN